MRSTLNQKDNEILFKNQTVDLGFGSNKNDYIEAFLYDTNDNLLETSIVEESDYSIDGESVKLKTGTILRKMGYDRGRYRVRYNFLRKVAGSYETILVDSDNKIWNGAYHIMDDGTIMDGETHSDSTYKKLFIKENKYILHEISPTRTEIRLIGQNIDDKQYQDDLFFAGKDRRKEKVDFSLNFHDEKNVNSEEVLSDSLILKASQDVPKSYAGGLLYLNDVFVEQKIFPPPPPDPSFIPEEETVGDIQARWIFSDLSLVNIRDGSSSTVNNTLNKMFLDFSTESEVNKNLRRGRPTSSVSRRIQSQLALRGHPYKNTVAERKEFYETNRGKTRNRIIRQGIAEQYRTPQFERGKVTLRSVSTKPSETALVRYTWTLSGKDFTQGQSYTGGIQSDKASIVESGGVRYQTESTNGSEITIDLKDNNTDIAVTLRIESKLPDGGKVVSSTLYIPNVIRIVKKGGKTWT